jgi:protein SCO1/2
VLKNYVTYFNPEFIGARGDYSDVYQLARNVNLTFAYTRVDDDNYLVNHNGEIMVMGPTGDNVGFLKAPYEPQRMLENFLALKSFSESQR